MSALIYGQQLSKAFGVRQLFNNVTIGVSEEDRIGLIGPNGSGKSTLLKILAGQESSDAGSVTRRQHLRIAYIPQQPVFRPNATVREELERFATASGVPSEEASIRVGELLGRSGFDDTHQLTHTLSGGWKKRLAIACGEIQNPDVMLLDEPTNHLDFEGLQWLEQVMTRAPWPWIMVSHDRWFLEHATNKIAEIHARYVNGMFFVTGTYTQFLKQREAHHHTQRQQAQSLENKVRREEEWLRRGPKARTSKAKFRIDSAHALQAELAETATRLRQHETTIDFVSSGRQTKQLIEATALSKAFGARTIIRNLDILLTPGTAMGIVGHNGSGKSTLLKLLAKELEPDHGSVRYAEKLQVVYFDQNRERIDPETTLRRMLSDTGQSVEHRGKAIHITAWAKRFRFQPEQLDLTMKSLSGGEQARAVIARLMLQPADVLIVDEPTNDLDIPTRETLEESLLEFSGALLLVTHDRYMLTQVCSQFIGLDGQGGFGLFADYAQWESWLRNRQAKPKKPEKQEPLEDHRQSKAKTKKLSFHEQREYDSMEARIIEAETKRDACLKEIERSDVVTNHTKLQDAIHALSAAEQTVERLYTRWTELENKKSN
ncbi:MAG: ABC-F family ATP-binding cassette domain-containing protein [Nitrospirales bacterium]|nr:ABC-F family ATP-binding cassette domain-containing protein [Nitrospira sp.]MDR4502878.1 ABC-F family ATP-binding cassette domain-containing protein [Nitrospirales bacterium]